MVLCWWGMGFLRVTIRFLVFFWEAAFFFIVSLLYPFFSRILRKGRKKRARFLETAWSAGRQRGVGYIYITYDPESFSRFLFSSLFLIVLAGCTYICMYVLQLFFFFPLTTYSFPFLFSISVSQSYLIRRARGNWFFFFSFFLSWVGEGVLSCYM